MTLRIASRGSKLALWQADYMKSKLKGIGLDAKVFAYKTTGDKVQDRFLHEIGGKGLFVKELEQALLDGEADLAVHSLKDLPVETPEPFELIAFNMRDSPKDVIIFSEDAAQRLSLPEKGKVFDQQALMLAGKLRIGTGSLRREALLKEASNTIEVIGIRGNVDTRIAKLEGDELDAIVLAEASLDRLDLKAGLHWRQLDSSWFVPSPSQGVLVIETRAGDENMQKLKELDCSQTRSALNIERGLLRKLGGDCTMPFGCYARFEDRQVPTKTGDHRDGRVLEVDAVVGTKKGEVCRASLTVPREYPLSAEKIIDELHKRLEDNNLQAILKKIGI